MCVKVSAAIVFWHLSAPEWRRFFARLPELHFVVWWICLGTEAWTDAGIVPMSSESRRTTNLLSTETWMWEATPFSASLNNHFKAKGIKTRFEGNYWQGCLFLDKSSISRYRKSLVTLLPPQWHPPARFLENHQWAICCVSLPMTKVMSLAILGESCFFPSDMLSNIFL